MHEVKYLFIHFGIIILYFTSGTFVLYHNKINKCNNKIMHHHLCVQNNFIVDLLPRSCFDEFLWNIWQLYRCITIHYYYYRCIYYTLITYYILYTILYINYALYTTDICFCLFNICKDRNIFSLWLRSKFSRLKRLLYWWSQFCLSAQQVDLIH